MTTPTIVLLAISLYVASITNVNAMYVVYAAMAWCFGINFITNKHFAK